MPLYTALWYTKHPGAPLCSVASLPRHLRTLQSGLYGDLQISPDFGEFGREYLPKMLTEYPEKGVLLTSAVESDGGNGFSALESPHVMPTGASQHHHSMRENALFPPPWCFAEESAQRGESRYTPLSVKGSCGIPRPELHR